jgi:phospholipid transport system transporter-binding protein
LSRDPVTPEPRRAGEVEILDRGDGCFAVRGELCFGTAMAALQMSKSLFAGHSVIELDLASVTRADSAGLALLLEWVNWARNTACEIRYLNIPASIIAIAQISEVEDMLYRAERWTGA